MSEVKVLCPSCGSDKVLHIREDLNKCMMCRQYFGDNAMPPKLEVYPDKVEVDELAATKRKEVETISEAQWKFINAVANRLTYAPYQRKHFRETFMKVFNGENTMQNWIDMTCVETGMKEEDLQRVVNEEFQKIPECMTEAGKKSLF